MTAAHSPAARWRQSQRARAATGRSASSHHGRRRTSPLTPASRRRRGRGARAAAAGHVQSGRCSISGGRRGGVGLEAVELGGHGGRGRPCRGRARSGRRSSSAMSRRVAMSTASREAGRSSRSSGPRAMVWTRTPFSAARRATCARVEAGGGVAAVGEEHDDAGAGGLGEDALQGEAEAVGDGGGAAGEADLGAVDGAGDGGEVPGERGGDIGAVGEDDDADAVAAAGLDEAGGDALDRVEAGGGLAVEGEVLDRHRAGEVEGEDDVAAGGGAVGDLDEALRPGGGDDEAEPEGGEEQAGAVEAAGGGGAGTGGDAGRQLERLAAGAAGRQQAHEEGERERAGRRGERRSQAWRLRPRMRASRARGVGRRRPCRGRRGGPSGSGVPRLGEEAELAEEALVGRAARRARARRVGDALAARARPQQRARGARRRGRRGGGRGRRRRGGPASRWR